MEDGEFRFFDYSGAPPIVGEQHVVKSWTGFYLPVNADRPGTADLEVDGQFFEMSTSFDITNPKTAYDRLCAERDTHGLFSAGHGKVMYFGTGHDCWGWSKNLKLVVGGATLPSPTALDTAEWTHPVRYEVSEGSMVLMNSCSQGSDLHDSERISFELPPATYLVDFAEPDGEYWISAFRFRIAS